MGQDRPHRELIRRWERPLALALWGLAACLALDAVRRPEVTQWDFKLYKSCALTVAAGGNPYSTRDIAKTLGWQMGMPCLYPPLVLQAYRPWAALSPGLRDHGAQLLWSLLKLAAIAGLILLWRRFVPIRADAPHLLFFLLAYGDPFLVDLRAGNMAALEQLLLWTGLALFAAGKGAGFGLAVAAAAQPKLMPVAFLPLALLRRRPDWKGFSAGTAAFAAIFSLNLLWPRLAELFYYELVRGEDTWWKEAGKINCSSFAFLRGAAGLLAGGEPGRGAWLLIAPFAVAVGAETLRASRAFSRGRPDDRESRSELALFYCAAYALLMPRFKDYSYMLLLPPTLRALSLPLPTGRKAALLVCACLNSAESLARKAGLGPFAFLFAYFKLYAAAQVWWALRARLLSAAPSAKP